MPFVSGTPESLIPRSDSKNPATTCKGITSSGRPCRRSLAGSPRSSPRSRSRNGSTGVLAVLPNVGENHASAAAFFCWQHQDQAANLATTNGNSQMVELKERSSIDTLVDRLGVLEVKDEKSTKKKKHGNNARASQSTTVQKETLPQQWQGVSGPLMAVPENSIEAKPSSAAASPPLKSTPKRRRRGDIHLSFFCCMRQASTDDLPPPRPRPDPKRTVDSHHAQHTLPSRPQLSVLLEASPAPEPTPSQTSRFLSLVPATVTPATASLLISELAKPLTPSDHEPGYIYIFWLTPTTVPRTAASQASSLLAPPGQPRRVGNVRRTSDVLRDFAGNQTNPDAGRAMMDHGDGTRKPAEKTIMLKIGRASNVHRRMNEWSRQCGHHITLLRYYPNPNHGSPSPSPSPSPHASPTRSPHPSPTPSNTSIPQSLSSTPQKAPWIQRVERLIHLELQDNRVKRECDGCGKEHREWFEVAASREGVKMVDECVRRWVGWAMHESGAQR